jgi:hypothetical protein
VTQGLVYTSVNHNHNHFAVPAQKVILGGFRVLNGKRITTERRHIAQAKGKATAVRGQAVKLEIGRSSPHPICSITSVLRNKPRVTPSY